MSLGARAVVSAAGAAAIARNGWSAASGPSGSCPARGNSDSSRPSSRRSQKPCGRERHRRRQDRLHDPAERVEPLDRGGQHRRRRAERAPQLLVAGGCIRPEVEPLLSDRQPDEGRGERSPLDDRHAVQLLEDTQRLRIIERRQQRRRARERSSPRVERRLLRLVGDDQHPEPAPRQQRRRDQTRRFAPTDDHVVEVRVDHAAWSYRLRNGAFPGAAPRTRTRRPSTTTRRSAIARTTAGSRRCSSARMRARSASSSSSS